jgi:hypothetical protein
MGRGCKPGAGDIGRRTDHGTMPSIISCHPPLASASPDQCTGVEQLRRPHIHVAIPTCRPALQDAKIWLGCGRGGLPLGDQGDDVPSLHAALSFLRYVFWLNMAFLKLVFTLLYNLTQFAQPNCGKEVVPLQPPIQNKTGIFPLRLRYHLLADTIYLYVTKTEPIYVHNTCTKFSGTYSNRAECRHAKAIECMHIQQISRLHAD